MDDSVARSQSNSLDLTQILHVLRERKWIIIGLAALGLAISLTLSNLSDPLYRATAKVLRQTSTLDKALFGAQIFQIDDQQRALTTAAGLVKLDRVARMVQTDLGTPRPVSSLQGMVTVNASAATDIISVTAVSVSGSEAADVANSFSRQFILYRQEADRATLRGARTELQGQLDAMTPEVQASARGLTLSQKAEELAVLESMQTGGYEMAQEATVPASAFAPRTVLNGGIALVLGLVAGIVIAFTLQFADRRIKDDATFEQEFGTGVIATVPILGKRWGSGRGRRSVAPIGFADRSPALEAYRSLRANLKFFEANRNITSILVTSALPREGKTITAINLSLSLAMSGSRVVVVEGDLRRPMLQKYLELKPGLGLSNILAGTHAVADVVQTIDTSAFFPPDKTGNPPDPTQRNLVKRNLLCIAAGPLPPNPAELLGSDRAAELLKELAALCDYVIIDGPPLLLVSDALELAKKVDGVLLVGRLRSTTIDEARKTCVSLRKVGVTPLGVVVSGATKAKAYQRRYGDYYAET